MIGFMIGFIFILATIGGIIIGYKFKNKIEEFILKFKK